MNESTSHRVRRLSRRSAISTAAAATLVALTNSPTSTAASPPPLSTPDQPMAFTNTIPPDWQRWRDIGFGTTLGDLLSQMVTETEVVTLLPEFDLEGQIEENRLTRLGLADVPEKLSTIAVRWNAATTDQALALGFALAMTRDQAPQGPEIWYQAALKHAGIVQRSEEDLAAAYALVDRACQENYRLQGFVRITPPESETA